MNIDKICYYHHQKDNQSDNRIPVDTSILSFYKNAMNKSQQDKKKKKVVKNQNTKSHETRKV